MPDYHERLWPTPWIYLASLLFVPATILVLAPVSLPAGIVTGVVIYLSVVGALSLTAPVIEVHQGRLRAGRAEISLDHTGKAVAAYGCRRPGRTRHRTRRSSLPRHPRLGAAGRAGADHRSRPTRRRTGWSRGVAPKNWPPRSMDRDGLSVQRATSRTRTPGRSARASSRGRSASGASPGSSSRR